MLRKRKEPRAKKSVATEKLALFLVSSLARPGAPGRAQSHSDMGEKTLGLLRQVARNANRVAIPKLAMAFGGSYRIRSNVAGSR
jgi:hypothetical protein